MVKIMVNTVETELAEWPQMETAGYEKYK